MESNSHLRKQKGRNKRAERRLFVGGVLNAPFAPQSFDVITCFHLLEHVHQLSEVVRTLQQWLKPGGILYLQVPNFRGLEASIFKSYRYGLEPRHLYHFSPSSLRRLFVCHDFEVELVRTLADCYIEKSVHYLVDDAFSKVGLTRTPLAAADGASSIPWRLIRKAIRMSILWPIREMSAAVGRGPAVEGMFRRKKETKSLETTPA
jgi:SAM-dependent methyltransferase